MLKTGKGAETEKERPQVYDAETRRVTERNDDTVCPTGNDLIGRLPQASRRQLLDRCSSVHLLPRQLLQERGLKIRYAYFIETGVALSQPELETVRPLISAVSVKRILWASR